MTREQADRIQITGIVAYRGRTARVNAVRVRGVEAPYFRLSDAATGEAVERGALISYRLCDAIEPAR
jgi:hypothetical protein